MEDEHGHITVVTEYMGNGLHNQYVGHYLLNNLCEIEMREPRAMTVQMPLYSEHRH